MITSSAFCFLLLSPPTYPELFTTYSPKTMYSFNCQFDSCTKLRNNAAHPFRVPSSNVHRTLGLRLHSVISILGMFGICFMHLLRCEPLEIAYYVWPTRPKWLPIPSGSFTECGLTTFDSSQAGISFSHGSLIKDDFSIFGLVSSTRLHSVRPHIYIKQIT